jgi:glutathione synthase/RimK-type ligase-like ATP-grasp enzyme
MGHSALAFDPRKWGSLLAAQSLSGRDEIIQLERSCLGRDEVSGVWVRFKPQRLTERQNTEDANVTRFVEAEWNAVIRGLYYFWSGASWVNPIYGGGGSKLEQIYIARECGLDVPETIVTNDPDAVRELIGRCGKVVYKSLTTTDFSEAHWIWTTLLDESRIEQYADNIRRAPGIFQEFVPKVYELRVTVVGDKIFPVKIVTPSEGPGVIDWRLSEPANNVELATIGSGVAEALLR